MGAPSSFWCVGISLEYESIVNLVYSAENVRELFAHCFCREHKLR